MNAKQVLEFAKKNNVEVSALGVARFYSNDFEGAQRDLAQVAERPETAAGANYFLARITRLRAPPVPA